MNNDHDRNDEAGRVLRTATSRPGASFSDPEIHLETGAQEAGGEAGPQRFTGKWTGNGFSSATKVGRTLGPIKLNARGELDPAGGSVVAPAGVNINQMCKEENWTMN
jgi:hypothetical protein